MKAENKDILNRVGLPGALNTDKSAFIAEESLNGEKILLSDPQKALIKVGFRGENYEFKFINGDARLEAFNRAERLAKDLDYGRVLGGELYPEEIALIYAFTKYTGKAFPANFLKSSEPVPELNPNPNKKIPKKPKCKVYIRYFGNQIYQFEPVSRSSLAFEIDGKRFDKNYYRGDGIFCKSSEVDPKTMANLRGLAAKTVKFDDLSTDEKAEVFFNLSINPLLRKELNLEGFLEDHFKSEGNLS